MYFDTVSILVLLIEFVSWQLKVYILSSRLIVLEKCINRPVSKTPVKHVYKSMLIIV